MYDISNLAKLKRLDEHATDAMKSFWAFDKAAICTGCDRWTEQAVDGGGSSADDTVPILHRVACPVST